MASTSLLGSCPSGRRSSNEAAGVSQQAVFVCDRFKYALKHVSVLYEFSTLIEPEDVSASPQPVDPASPESARKPVGYQSVPCRWRTIIFRPALMFSQRSRSPPRALIQVMRSELRQAIRTLVKSPGLYGVVSHLTARRSREFAVRLAVGATPANLLAMVFRHSLARGSLGLAVRPS